MFVVASVEKNYVEKGRVDNQAVYRKPTRSLYPRSSQKRRNRYLIYSLHVWQFISIYYD